MDVIARMAGKAKLMIFLVLGLVIASLTVIDSPEIIDSILPQSKAHADTMISYPSVHAKSASSSREEIVSSAFVSSTREIKQSCFAPELFPIDLESRKPNCKFLPESISDGMCLRSITNNGDESRFLPALKKIQSRQCITILVFGGSISNGNCRIRSHDPDKPLGKSEAWLPRLEYILNARYPCNGQHSVINYAMSNRGTDHHFQTMRRADTQDALASADIVIMEASVNDVASAYHLKSFGKGLGVRSNMLQFWTEATIRLLRGKFPHLALLWVEASTRAWKGQSEAGKLRAPYRSDASADHLEVLQYYDIPQIDVMRALGAGGLPLEQEFRTECYFCDFVHPTRYGQNITASIVASAFDRMLEHSQSQHIEQRYRKTDDQDLSDLPDPLTMTEKLDDAMRSEDITRVTLDTQESFDKHVVGAGSRDGAFGWSFDTDMEGKPKTAMTMKSDSCVTVDLDFSSRVSLLSFELFHSYNNVGTALVKLLEKCTATKDTFVTLGGVEKLKLRWHDQVSIGVERFIDHDFSKLGHDDCAKFVSVCAKNDNGSGKVKLYSVFASSAFQR